MSEKERLIRIGSMQRQIFNKVVKYVIFLVVMRPVPNLEGKNLRF